MSDRLYHIIASIIFSVIAIVHFARVLEEWPATVANIPIPVWVSWVAVILAAFLAIRGFMFAKKYSKQERM